MNLFEFHLLLHINLLFVTYIRNDTIIELLTPFSYGRITKMSLLSYRREVFFFMKRLLKESFHRFSSGFEKLLSSIRLN